MKVFFSFLVVGVSLLGCEQKSLWTYSESIDELRNSKINLASIKSDRKFSSKNGLEITLEQRPQEPPNVKFTLDNEKYSCDKLSYCYALIKLDNNQLQTIELSKKSDNITVIKDKEVARKLTQSLATSKQMLIEMPLQNNQKQQFQFTLPPLKLATYTDKEINKAKRKGFNELDSFSDAWEVKLKIVHSTPRIALLPVVLDLKETRKNLDAIEVSDCLLPAKKSLGEYMDLRIESVIDFINDNYNSSTITKGDKAIIDYVIVKNHCIKN